MFNISCRKVGGLWFLKIGRLCFTFCVARERYHAVRAPAPRQRLRMSADDVLVLDFMGDEHVWGDHAAVKRAAAEMVDTQGPWITPRAWHKLEDDDHA